MVVAGKFTSGQIMMDPSAYVVCVFRTIFDSLLQGTWWPQTMPVTRCMKALDPDTDSAYQPWMWFMTWRWDWDSYLLMQYPAGVGLIAALGSLCNWENSRWYHTWSHDQHQDPEAVVHFWAVTEVHQSGLGGLNQSLLIGQAPACLAGWLQMEHLPDKILIQILIQIPLLPLWGAQSSLLCPQMMCQHQLCFQMADCLPVLRDQIPSASTAWLGSDPLLQAFCTWLHASSLCEQSSWCKLRVSFSHLVFPSQLLMANSWAFARTAAKFSNAASSQISSSSSLSHVISRSESLTQSTLGRSSSSSKRSYTK